MTQETNQTQAETQDTCFACGQPGPGQQHMTVVTLPGPREERICHGCRFHQNGTAETPEWER